MRDKPYFPLFLVVAFSVIAYLAHQFIFSFFGLNAIAETYYFPLWAVYLFFACCSFAILFILIRVKKKNIDNVGYTFLLLTSIKMAVSMAAIFPMLNPEGGNQGHEKLNFFIVFALFLTMETLVTIRILNPRK